MVCHTESGRYCTDLDTYTSKEQQVSVHAKCYSKELMSPTYLSGSTYQLYFCIHFLIWLYPGIAWFVYVPIHIEMSDLLVLRLGIQIC